MRVPPLLAGAALCALALPAVSATTATGLATAPAGAASVRSAASAVPSDLTQVRVRQSLLGSHTWYQQTHGGIPVLGGYYAVHTSRGASTVQDGRLAVTGLVMPRTRITPAAAQQAAAPHGSARSTRLVIVPGATARLAYDVRTSADKQVLVGASDGKVLKVVDERRLADATGKVFDPNPVVSLQNEGLKDSNNAASAVPAAAYRTATLQHLDTSGYLHGTYATVVNKAKGKVPGVKATNGTFDFDRSQTGFEQVNAYYAVDTVQSYFQSLGFTDVNNEAQDLSVDTVTDDNSWYSPSTDTITFGTGGVDDAEDQEVVWHEYGHSVQDDQVPGFGSTEEGGAIGEGFGDYLAMTMTQANSPDTATTPWACVMDWDSTSYTSTTPHCIRRLDTGKTVANKTGEVHDDGEIWSQALFDINKGLGREKANKVILEGQFSYAPNTDFAGAAQKTVDAATALYGSTDASTVRAAFHARGIL
ncbi:M4 family metallopeptidase [Luteipulveratus flavus]|uniref:M4 family metallopeptidase n=1 Tax=Luteipulveratus flavus TaxID=3031728 RepID=A0ABT6CBD7_9MICO|nr:M4 family metallopeptidase [Luteipulveratus sp. YIM 133296]MDF8266110.1 M4 family metallopeptidase [Luteipulveratus sp. YIM 133296]